MSKVSVSWTPWNEVLGTWLLSSMFVSADGPQRGYNSLPRGGDYNNFGGRRDMRTDNRNGGPR